MSSLPGFFRIRKIDHFHPEESLVMFLVLGLSHESPDYISVAKTETPDLRSGNINVIVAREKTFRSQKTITIPKYLKDPSTETIAHIFCLFLQKGQYKAVLSHGA